MKLLKESVTQRDYNVFVIPGQKFIFIYANQRDAEKIARSTTIYEIIDDPGYKVFLSLPKEDLYDTIEQNIKAKMSNDAVLRTVNTIDFSEYNNGQTYRMFLVSKFVDDSRVIFYFKNVYEFVWAVGSGYAYQLHADKRYDMVMLNHIFEGDIYVYKITRKSDDVAIIIELGDVGSVFVDFIIVQPDDEIKDSFELFEGIFEFVSNKFKNRNIYAIIKNGSIFQKYIEMFDVKHRHDLIEASSEFIEDLINKRSVYDVSNITIYELNKRSIGRPAVHA